MLSGQLPEHTVGRMADPDGTGSDRERLEDAKPVAAGGVGRAVCDLRIDGADHRAVSVHQPHLVAADDGQPEPVPARDCLQHQGDQLLAGLYEPGWNVRSEEHTSELQSLMRNSY